MPTRFSVVFGCAIALLSAGAAAQGQTPPNVIIIFTDDQGYGDLGSYGHPTIRTPVLDEMAREGQRWTSFYAAPVCTPSRGQLLTGRLAIRTGTAGGVFHPPSTGGLQPSEVTIAEVLKERGYVTGMVGKWHLGHRPEYLPTRQGFDFYFGVPYSNDMDFTFPDEVGGDWLSAFMNPAVEYWNVPLMRGEEIIERPADQTTLTRRYTDQAVSFIRDHQDESFFLYLAHNMPHMPLFRSTDFEGRSERGRYGDVIEEIDFNIGRILDTLRELELDENTLVVFLSDNGPWLPYREQGGSAGTLRGGKGSNWEGGVRVPAIFWGPGIVEPAVVTGMGSELDLLPTIASLAGATPPSDRPLDGVDLSESLREAAPSPRDHVYFYSSNLVAVRRGPWKLILQPPTFDSSGGVGAGSVGEGAGPNPPDVLLYNLDEDPSEKFDVAAARPDVVADLTAFAQAHMANVEPGEDQLAAGLEGYFEQFR